MQLTPAQLKAIQLLHQHRQAVSGRSTRYLAQFDRLEIAGQTITRLEHAGLIKPAGQAWELTPAGAAQVPAVSAPPAKAAMRAPRHVAVYSQISTERRTPRYSPRRTMFVRGDSGQSVAQLIEAAQREGVERVMLTSAGPAPAESWYLAALPPAWKHGSHFLGDPSSATGRYFRSTAAEPGRRIEVEISQARSWFADADADTCAAAWAWLESWIGLQAAECRLLSTPVTTGRDLWRRTIARTAAYPVLSDEVRQLVHATSPQHRRELLEPRSPELRGFAYLDARLAYAAVAWGMPVGPGAWIGGVRDPDEITTLVTGRGRWRIRAQVPDSWAHVGILPHPMGADAWEWPNQPGRRFETWADACEVSLALSHGWPVEVIEGFRMTEGKPLNTFTDRITQAIDSLPRQGLSPAVAAAVRYGLRAMFVGLIGGFAQRGHDVWRSAPIRPGEPIPAPPGVNVTRAPDGKTAFWREQQARSDLTFAHPEWAATIWARARCRLLDSPPPAPGFHRVGALSLPRESIIAFAADSLYLDRNPNWPDDGKRGRFRLKGQELRFGPDDIRVIVPAPDSWEKVQILRSVAEGSL